jgi:hypothetical protein
MFISKMTTKRMNIVISDEQKISTHSLGQSGRSKATAMNIFGTTLFGT